MEGGRVRRRVVQDRMMRECLEKNCSSNHPRDIVRVVAVDLWVVKCKWMFDACLSKVA